MAWTYPVRLRARLGGVLASCPEMPEAVASGRTREEALAVMRDALAEAVRGLMRDGAEIRPPGGEGEGPDVTLPAHLASKASAYVLWRRSGLSKTALAELMGRSETEARRLLDPDHGTKVAQIEEAVAALGGCLVVSVRPAAPTEAEAYSAKNASVSGARGS